MHDALDCFVGEVLLSHCCQLNDEFNMVTFIFLFNYVLDFKCSHIPFYVRSSILYILYYLALILILYLITVDQVMVAYGYNIEHILMVDIVPDSNVRTAMNEINAGHYFNLFLAGVLSGHRIALMF